VTPAAFNRTTGGGITFTNLFAGWPKASLATVHNDPVPVTQDVCERYFRLTSGDIRRWGPFESLTRAGAAGLGPGTSGAAPAGPGMLRLAKQAIFGDGLPEVATISPALGRWVAEFRPELLYTILGSNAMMSLVEQLRVRFHLPLVLHFMDDWPATLYRGGMLSFIQRQKMERLLARLISEARLNLAIGDAMAAAYTARYGTPFTAFQNTIELAQWSSPSPKPESSAAPVILYVGSVLPFAQLESLIDCCHAVAALPQSGVAARLEIYSPLHNAEQYRPRIEVAANVRLFDTITDDAALFEKLRSADVLLLPVNFDEHTVRYIRYSMPTKVPAYLASGVPVLVYGPADVAQVDYAARAGWGHVLAKRGVDGVTAALRDLLNDSDLRERLGSRALAAARNHDAAFVRPRFQSALRQAAGPQVPRARVARSNSSLKDW
jgi:glycosyltransferase involved in cell wall biosynthesis